MNVMGGREPPELSAEFFTLHTDVGSRGRGRGGVRNHKPP